MPNRFCVLTCFLIACNGSGSTSSAPQSCDRAAEHLIDVCEPSTGEDFRALCEIEEPPIVSARQRQCVGSLKTCTEASIKACDVQHIVIGCAQDSDCPKPFTCDVDEEECVRCKVDDDCDPGRGCLSGLCYDASSPFYKTFSKIAALDGGAQ